MMTSEPEHTIFDGNMNMIDVYHSKLDAGGRLYIPREVQEVIGKAFQVTFSSEKCLNVFSVERWQEMLDKIAAMGKEKQLKMRPLFFHAESFEVDDQGYIVLSKHLKDFAALKNKVTFVGRGNAMFVDHGNTVEIWDSDIWKARPSERPSS